MDKQLKEELKKIDALDVDVLRQIFADYNDYVDVQKEYLVLTGKIDAKVEEYKQVIYKKYETKKVVKERNDAYHNVHSFDEYDRSGMYSPEIELKKKQAEKHFADMELKITELSIAIDNEIAAYRKKLNDKYALQLNLLATNVFERAKNVFDLEKIKNVKRSNEYLQIILEKDIDYIYKNDIAFLKDQLYLNKWLRLSYSVSDKMKMFDTENILKDYLSVYDYFLNQLKKQTGKKYDKFTIITSQTEEDRPEGYWDNWDYYVYGATLLMPEDLAKELQATEKVLTKELLEKFIDKHNDVILLYEDKVRYLSTQNYKQGLEDVENYRDFAREEMGKLEESNEVSMSKVFGITKPHYGFNTKLKMPSNEVANAIFNTLEYSKKVLKLSKYNECMNQNKDFDNIEKEHINNL